MQSLAVNQSVDNLGGRPDRVEDEESIDRGKELQRGVGRTESFLKDQASRCSPELGP